MILNLDIHKYPVMLTQFLRSEKFFSVANTGKYR